MTPHDIEVELLEPRFRAEYSRVPIFVGTEVGYFVHRQIPMLWTAKDIPAQAPWSRTTSLPTREVFQAAMLLARTHYPSFTFPPVSPVSIHINTLGALEPEKIAARVSAIIDGSEPAPVLYDVWQDGDVDDPTAKIRSIREQDTYVDLFHAPQVPFMELVNRFSRSFEFSNFIPDADAVRSLYSLITGADRHIHIALHYLIIAAQLIPNYFSEDGGLNLNLASEAIIKHHMQVSGLSNKPKAVENLLGECLGFPQEKIDWLIELYEARNEFLAHIDEGMFTSEQSIDDPDGYCYDHYPDICDLIIAYMKFRHAQRP